MKLYLFFIFALLFWAHNIHAQALPPIEQSYTSRIVEDTDFTGGFAISPKDIQDFLDEKGEDCSGNLCIKNYRDEETNKSAAEIIHKHAHSFALHPYIVLATLQKETSLITEAEPAEWQYRTAMGYGCPDGADCDSDFFGFDNQVRLGANLLRAGYDRACGDRLSHFRWYVHPRWAPGSYTPIDGRSTYIANCATASLYNYTPHRVDSGWIESDDQFYYGNYNFVILFQNWF